MSIVNRQEETLYTPRRAQKCLFASSNSNFCKKSMSQDLNRSRDEAFSGDESDLGPMSPLALTDRSPSSGSSSGREFISPFATPEKFSFSHNMPVSWDRLRSRRCMEERISPFSSLKKITRSARYSPKCKSFNSSSLPSSLIKSTKAQHLKSTTDEIVPETPPRSFATEIQNQIITETPRKSRSPRQITPLKSITKTAPLPKLHRRKSFSIFEMDSTSSPEAKENTLKRRAPHDQIKPAKLFKADDTFAPKARAALFQENKNESSECSATFSLSTKTFYSSSSRTERPFAFGNFKNNDVKKRRSLPPQSSRRSIGKKQKFGKINAGVFHGIKKRKPKINPETLKKEGENVAALNKSPPIEMAQSIDMIAERAPTPEIDENKRFFKTVNSSHGATVTVNNKIKLKVTDGKLVLNQKRIPSKTNANKQSAKAVNISLDATDLTVDEPEVETTLKKDKVVDKLLKMLEDDWTDNYDTMETLNVGVPTTVSPLKPVAIIPTDEIMSPASELTNMTSTMNIKDALLTNIESLSLEMGNKNKTEKTGEKEKYFPLFTKGYSAPDNIFEEANNAKLSKVGKKKTQWQLSAKGGGAENQYQLDAGQKRFGATQCPECNVVYQLGDPEDENAHLNYHNSIRILKFQGWKNERVIMEDPFTSSRIILIEPHDSKQHWKKVSEILAVVDRDLGLADMEMSDCENKKIFLYIREKSVLGVLVTEPIKTAYRMIPELIELNCCTAESTPTKCGVNVIWTAMSHRRQGIATKLLDTLRAKYFYGYVMSLDDIAFSIPTPSGKIFAEKYTKIQNFKVYN